MEVEANGSAAAAAGSNEGVAPVDGQGEEGHDRLVPVVVHRSTVPGPLLSCPEDNRGPGITGMYGWCSDEADDVAEGGNCDEGWLVCGPNIFFYVARYQFLRRHYFAS